jgi:hypothetical protein
LVEELLLGGSSHLLKLFLVPGTTRLPRVLAICTFELAPLERRPLLLVVAAVVAGVSVLHCSLLPPLWV